MGRSSILRIELRPLFVSVPQRHTAPVTASDSLLNRLISSLLNFNNLWDYTPMRTTLGMMCGKFATQVACNSAFRRVLIISYVLYLPVVGSIASSAVSLQEIFEDRPRSPSVDLVLNVLWGIAVLCLVSYGAVFPLMLVIGSTNREYDDNGEDPLPNGGDHGAENPIEKVQ